MRHTLTFVLPLAALLGACGGDDPVAPEGARPYAECADVTPYAPTAGWRSNCPGALGIDTTRLRGALNDIEGQMPTMRAFLVARRGYVALESYWNGTRATTPVEIRSVTKAVTASVVAIEIGAGRIPGMETLMSTWYPWLATGTDGRRAEVRLRHVLDMSAGYLMDANGTNPTDRATWFLSRPMRAEPGTTWEYDEGLYEVASYLVREVDERGTRTVAREELFGPLGIADAASRWPVDEASNAWGASGLELTAREMLSFGELYRLQGMWDGRQVLPAGWVAPMLVRPAGVTDDQMVWFRGWRQIILGGHLTLVAAGHGGQYIIIVPDLELVVAAAADPNAPQGSAPPVLSLVRDHLIPGMTAD